MNPIRVYLVDDHQMFRQGLKMLLAETEGIEVVGEAGTFASALQAIDSLLPDIVLLDVSMPDQNGFEAAASLLQRHPNIKVILVSVHAIEEYARRAAELGAAGYLVKDSHPEQLFEMIRKASRGEGFQTASQPRPPASGMSNGKLTARQTEILRQIALGRKLHEIADDLHISVRTAERHRANIKQVLGIQSPAALIRYAVRNGLVEDAATHSNRDDT